MTAYKGTEIKKGDSEFRRRRKTLLVKAIEELWFRVLKKKFGGAHREQKGKHDCCAGCRIGGQF